MQLKFRRKWRWLSLVLAVTFLLSSILPAGAASVLQPGKPPGDSSDIVPGEIVVKFRPGVEAAGKARVSATGAKKLASAQTGAELYALPHGSAVQDVLKQLQADPNVAYAEPNKYRKLHLNKSSGDGEVSTSPDTYIAQQWNLGAISAQNAWSDLAGLTGSITVAVVDTGVDGGHRDLAGRVSSGINYVAKKSDGTAYNQSDTSDDNGHGTHVAGIIAAVTDNGLGIAGVAGPANVSVLPVKVLNDQGWGTSFDVSRGIVYAADNGAGIINLSLGGRYSSVEAEAVAYAQQKNCLVVAAAGNDDMNADNMAFPAALPGVLTVAATDSGNSKAWFSNYGNCVDIAAPGVSILSTVPASVGGEVYESGNYYDYYSGTSMATPHVSAAAAMYMLKNDSASAVETFNVLTSTAGDLGDPGKDPYYGYGLLDIAAALKIEPQTQDEVRFVRPAEGSTVFSKVGLAVQVARPETVDHLEFYLDSESTSIGKVNRTALDKPQVTYELEWDSAALDESGNPKFQDGDHQLIAIAYNSDNGKLGEASLPIKLKNTVETGLSFQILDPKGNPASHAWMVVLLKKTFHYEGEGEGIGSLTTPGDQQPHEGYYYDLVADLPADADGRVRIPGTLARDLNDFVVVVNGVFNEGGRDVTFLYQRRVEGPKGMVIDGANAVQTFLTALDKDGAALPAPDYRAALLDENGVAYMYAFLSAGDPLSRAATYLDKGIYDLFALSKTSDGTYFLFRNGYKVESAGTVPFDGRNAGALKASKSSGQKEIFLYIHGKKPFEFGSYFGIRADGAVYLSPGRYHYSADVFQEDAAGTNWLYWMYKPEAVDIAEREVRQLSFGGDFSSELTYPDSVNDTVYKDQDLWVKNKFTDAEGHRLGWAEKNVELPPDGEVLKLNLPGKTPVYSTPGPQGSWQAVANNGSETIRPYFTLRKSDDSVVAQTYGYFDGYYYVPLTDTSAGSYTGRVEAGAGPIASGQLMADRPLTVMEREAMPSVSTVVYGLDSRPAPNAELELYRWRNEYSGYDFWFNGYSDQNGKINVPVEQLTSYGDEPDRVNVALVGYRTADGDSVAMVRAFRGAALPPEIRTDTTRPVTQEVYDHGGNPVTYPEPGVIFAPVLDGQKLADLKIYPDYLGSNYWLMPNTSTVYLEPGTYHFVDQFTNYPEQGGMPESYYLIAPNVQVGDNGAQFTLDGRESAAAKLALDVKGEGYLREHGYEPLFLPFNQYDNSLSPMPLIGTTYVTGGNIDYYPLADVVRTDPERTQDIWNYLLAWEGENGKTRQFSVGDEVYRNFGSEYNAALQLDKDLYTRVEDITGTSVFRDTYGNRLVDLLVWNELFYDYMYASTSLSANTAGSGGQKSAVQPYFGRRADGRIAVNAMKGSEASASQWYKINYVDPFLYFYRGTGADGERVFKDSDYQYYYGFEVPADKIGSTTGAYQAEVALGAGPAGPVIAQDTFIFSGGGIAISAPADGTWLAGRTFTVRGVADGGASVNLFVYQGDTPGAGPDYTITTDAGGSFEQTVTVSADGQWKLLAEQVDRGYRAEVTVQVDTAAPLAPTNLNAVSSADGRKVTLNWDQTGEEGLLARVERSTAGGSYTLLAEKLAGNSYDDTTVQPGTGYSYRVAWTDRAGNASAYATATVSTSDPVRIDTASVTAQKGPSGYLKPGKDLQVTVRGTAGATPQAIACLTRNGQEATENINLTENNGIYSGSLPIPAGTTAVRRIDVTLSKDGQTSRTLDALGGRPLSVGGNLAGTVTQNGQPVNSAQVSAYASGGDYTSTTTAQDGAFSFEGLKPGSYTLFTSGNNTTARAVYDLAAGEALSGIALILPARYDLTVEVQDKEDATMDFTGLYVALSGQGYEQVKKQDDGKYTAVFRNLPAGQYRWWTYGAWNLKPQYFDVGYSENQTVDVGEGKTSLTVKLESLASRYGKIKGRVLYAGGNNPVPGAEVSAYSSKLWSGKNVKTDDQGRFEIDMLTPSDDYSLLVSHPDYIAANLTGKTVSAGEGNALDVGDISLNPGYSVSGAVYGVDENNVKTPLADVAVFASGSGSYRYVRTDGEGRYRIGGLPAAGSYKVGTYASPLGYRDQNATVNLTDAERDKTSDFTLSVMGSIDGTVRGQKGSETNPLQYVYLNASGPSWGWARTDKSGYYIMRRLETGSYNLNTNNYLGYVDQSMSGVSVVDGRRTKQDFTLLSLDDAKKVFSGAGNGLTVSAPYAAPGERLTYRATYKNNGTTGFVAENVSITFDLPENAAYVSGSLAVNGSAQTPTIADGKFTVALGNVTVGDSGVIVYQVDVSSSAVDEAELVSKGTIAWQYNSNEGVKSEVQPLGLAGTNLVFTTINAPAQTADGKLKVYGKSVPGAKIRIYDTYSGSETVVGSAEAFGRWWNAELNLYGYGEHRLRAAADLGTRQSNPSTTVSVTYDTGIPVINDVIVTAGWNKDVHVNPYLGVAAMGLTERYPISVDVDFASGVDSVYFWWLGSDSKEKKYDLNYSGGKWSVTTDYGWQDYGEKLITLIVKSGTKEYQFPLLLITVLIDPSGYVYEGVPSNRLAGVRATVEEYKNGVWTPWNAAAFGQVNPQVTDDQGRYGWDVPAGTWRVVFSKVGCDTYNSYPDWNGQVPPPKTDLNVNMMNTATPDVASATPASGATGVAINTTVSVTFSKYMAVTSVSDTNFKLKTDGTEVTGAISAQNAENGLAKAFVFTPSGDLANNTIYTVQIGEGIVDYTGRSLPAQNWTFTTAAAPDTTPPAEVTNLQVSAGGGKLTVSWTEPSDSDFAKVRVYWKAAGQSYGTPVDVPKGTASYEITGLTNGTAYTVKVTTVDATGNESAGATVTGTPSSGGGGTGPGGGGGGGVAQPQAGQPVSQNVPASSGGTVATGDKAVTVTIPAAALSADGTVKIAEVTGSSVPELGDFSLGGKVFDITVENATLNQPVTLTFKYDAAKLSGVAADKIGLYYWNTARNRWIYIGGTVDTTVGQVTAPVKHFTRFAVLANDKLPALTDVKSHWAYNEIKRLVGMEVVNGYPDNTYKPDNNVTRAEFAKVIVEAMGWPAGSGDLSFADTASVPAWARGYIATAVEKGVIKGYEDNTFRADQLISRAEIAAMVIRSLGKESDAAKAGALNFSDAASVKAWAKGYVSVAADQGIVKGKPGNTFAPADNATRAESAAMVVRMLNNLGI